MYFEDWWGLFAPQSRRTFVSAVYPAGPVFPTSPLQIRTDLPYRGRQWYLRRAGVQCYLPAYWPNSLEKLPKQKSQGSDIGSAPILDLLLYLAYWYRFWQRCCRHLSRLPHDLCGLLFLIRLPDPHSAGYLPIRLITVAQ